MNRILFALTIAAGLSVAAPVAAMSFQFSLPTLTYPPQPTPETTQGCADLTTDTGATCTTPAK